MLRNEGIIYLVRAQNFTRNIIPTFWYADVRVSIRE